MLVNNAGLVQSRRAETPDGIELTLAVNHLAPFLLTNLLLDLLRESAPSRIVTVSSEASRGARIDFEDLQSERRYRAFKVYGMTKLANILFTYELAERLEGTGVVANCLHPGGVNTNFANGNRTFGTLLFRAFKPFMRTPEQGADTVVYLASSPEAGSMTGRYLIDRKVVSSFEEPHDVVAQKGCGMSARSSPTSRARRRVWGLVESVGPQGRHRGRLVREFPGAVDAPRAASCAAPAYAIGGTRRKGGR